MKNQDHEFTHNACFSTKTLNIILVWSKTFGHTPLLSWAACTWFHTMTPIVNCFAFALQWHHRLSLRGSVYPNCFFCTIIPILFIILWPTFVRGATAGHELQQLSNLIIPYNLKTSTHKAYNTATSSISPDLSLATPDIACRATWAVIQELPSDHLPLTHITP